MCNSNRGRLKVRHYLLQKLNLSIHKFYGQQSYYFHDLLTTPRLNAFDQYYNIYTQWRALCVLQAVWATNPIEAFVKITLPRQKNIKMIDTNYKTKIVRQKSV